MLAPTIYLLIFIAYVQCCGMVASDMFFPERQMSEDRNHFHGMKNHPPHGMAMNGRDQPTISRCVCQIRNPRVGQVDNDWIWLVNDDYLMIIWMMMIIIHYYYWWMMMSTASYFSSRRRWFFGAWRCSRSLDQGHRSLDVEHEKPRAAEPNHLWISATISNVSSEHGYHRTTPSKI